MTADTALRTPRGSYFSPRQEARQRRILEAAREEISAVGYDAITMQALARASGVSTKTLYNLYGTKDQLLLAAVADLLGNLEQQQDVVAAAAGIPKLLAFSDSAFAQVERTPRYAEVMARSLYQAPAGHTLVEVLLGNAHRVVAGALQAEQARGGFSEPVDLGELADALVAQQWGLVLLWSKGLIQLADIRSRARRGQLMILLPLCSAARRRELQLKDTRAQ